MAGCPVQAAQRAGEACEDQGRPAWEGGEASGARTSGASVMLGGRVLRVLSPFTQASATRQGCPSLPRPNLRPTDHTAIEAPPFLPWSATALQSPNTPEGGQARRGAPSELSFPDVLSLAPHFCPITPFPLPSRTLHPRHHTACLPGASPRPHQECAFMRAPHRVPGSRPWLCTCV